MLTGSVCLHLDVDFTCVLQDFREKEASVIDIPNIGYETFTAMMRYIYVGTVEVEQEQALPLLQVRTGAVAGHMQAVVHLL